MPGAGQPLPPVEINDLDATTWNEIAIEVVKEAAEEDWETLLDAYPDFQIPPGVVPPPQQRLQNYWQDILVGAQGDPALAEQRQRALLDPGFMDYVDLMAGEGLPVTSISPLWDALLPMPKVMAHFLADFRQCYRDWAQKQAPMLAMQTMQPQAVA